MTIHLFKGKYFILSHSYPVFIFGFLLLMATMSDTISAKTFYVRSTAEISTAMQTALPGDTLLMATGTWTNQKIVFKGNGNSVKSIYLVAESPGNVIMSGTSTLRIGGNYLVVDGLSFKNGYSSSGGVIEFRDDSGNESNYCRLTKTSIVDYNPSNTTTDYKWVSLYGTHNRVDHCLS